MAVSVVLACHTERRWALLRRAIDSALAQSAPADEVLVVVDHNPALLARLQSLPLPITVLANASERGASGARNTGAFAAGTELIAFLDDDACADADWLGALVRSLDDRQVVGTGGHVVADWQAGRPRWFPDEFAWVVGATHRGAATPDGRLRNVWAENMAVRGDAFRAVGGFRTGFGKIGAHSRPEDTDLCIRMAARAGGQPGQWRYERDAVVSHHVPAERSTFAFYLRRCYHEGRGKAELVTLLDVPGDALTAERRYTTQVLPAAVLRHLLRALVRRSGDDALRAAAIVIGFAVTVAGYLVGRTVTRTRPAVRPAVVPIAVPAAVPVPGDVVGLAS